MLIAGGILKLGWIANLLSTPVITGFLTGIAVHIVVSQLPGIFGIARGTGNLVSQVLVIASSLSKLNPFSSVIGLGVFATMVLAERISGRIPGAPRWRPSLCWPSTSKVVASPFLEPCQEVYLALPYRLSTFCANSPHWHLSSPS